MTFNLRPNTTMSCIAFSVALALGSSAAHAQTTPQEQLTHRLDELTQEIEKLKAQLQEMQKTQQTQQSQIQAVKDTPPPTEPATVVTGYGEMNYNRPKDRSQTQADLRRFVIGIEHRVDEKTKIASELEVEHAVASSSDNGEVEVEQMYVERKLNETYNMRAGLVLMPVGLLNTNHEPTAYYGVERNFVETAIIPSTWREGGLMFTGEYNNGISWTGGMTTGFNLGKWDATSSDGRTSPLGSIHQEMQQASAGDLATVMNVEWRGVPGLRLGTSGFTGKASQRAKNFSAPDARVSIWDFHARWTPGAWDLAALYARGNISGAGALNQTFAGSPYPVPQRFDGWYTQLAYRWHFGDEYVLAPFTRYERYNTGRNFEGLPVGLNPGNVGTETVRTMGLNFELNPSVVFKADLQRFKQNKDNNRLDLGMGYAF